MKRLVPEDRELLLGDGTEGLIQQQVEQNRRQFGSNQIAEVQSAGWPATLKDTLADPMLWFLLICSALFGLAGEYIEAVILLLALLPIFGMDTWLHRRARVSTAALDSALSSTCQVFRDGRQQTIPAAELVPGDLTILAPGDSVPADGFLVQADQVQIDESTLSGEALPVRKRAYQGLDAPEEEALAFAGTRVLVGQGQLRVVWTGGETLYGEIVRMAISGGKERTPLQLAIADLVRNLLIIAILFCLLLAGVRLAQGHGFVDALLSGLTLAVAALPEEFPVVLTVFLGVGVFRLARRQALVRRAAVVEGIGRVTCLCFDKTGTLTEGTLQLNETVPAEIIDEDELLALAALASRADSHDPLDQAILTATSPPVVELLQRFPYTETRQLEAVVVNIKGRPVMIIKGAPERLLEASVSSQAEQTDWSQELARLASHGLKVIACARRQLKPDEEATPEQLDGVEFLGLLAFGDPLRAGVVEAIQQCRQAGIRLVMVTGDRADTSSAIARQAGLGADPPALIEGQDLERKLDQAGHPPLGHFDIVARALPAQKLKLVKHLQASGEYVALTGDGTNDVPAIKAANVGIAMGLRGTRAAREVADIVLMDDRLQTVVQAIAEGRQLLENLRRSFQYLLLIHIPLVLTAALIPLAGYPLLYRPIHIVWLELIIHPTALLAFQETPGRLLSGAGPPRLLSQRDWRRLLGLGGLITILLALAFLYGLQTGQGVEVGRSLAIMMLICASAAITIGLAGFAERRALWISVCCLGGSAALVQVQPLAALLGLHPLSFRHWGLISIAGVLVLLLTLVLFRQKHQVSHQLN